MMNLCQPRSLLAEYRLTDFRKGFWLFDLFASTAASSASWGGGSDSYLLWRAWRSIPLHRSDLWMVQGSLEVWRPGHVGSWGLFGLQDLCIVDARSILQAASHSGRRLCTTLCLAMLVFTPRMRGLSKLKTLHLEIAPSQWLLKALEQIVRHGFVHLRWCRLIPHPFLKAKQMRSVRLKPLFRALLCSQFKH